MAGTVRGPPTAQFADTFEEIARIQGSPPPIVAAPLTSGAMISRAWVNEPIRDHVGPMEDHVIAATIRGDGHSAVRNGTRLLRTPSVAGGITIAPRGFSGDFDCDGRPVTANVFLSRERLQRCADELDGGRPPELLPRLNSHDPKLFSILSLICAEAEEPGPHQHIYFEQLIDLLCTQLLREHSAFPLACDLRSAGLATWQVVRVTAYMREHLDQVIELKQLADLLGLSPHYFCTAFRKSTGFTPHHWLVRLRMDCARRLLASTQMTITDIALAVGYATPSSFAQAFRAVTGFTPRHFRRCSA